MSLKEQGSTSTADTLERANTRVVTPTVLQMEAVECGAASLAMILAYHGCWVPLEVLRIRCGVTRDGSKASSLLKAARGFGLSARGFKKEPSDLLDLPVPAIIHWNFNHYVVFEGFRKGKACLNDPAIGPKQVTLQEFDQAFTGVALAFEPDDEFQKQGAAPSLFALLAKHIRQEKAALAYVLIVSLLLVIPTVALAGLTQLFIDEVLVANSSNWIKGLLGGIVLIGLLRAMLVWLQQKYLLRLETKLAMKMATGFVWHLLFLPMQFFTQRHAGDLSNRVLANDRVAMLLSGELATNTVNLIAVFFYGAVMAMYDPWLAAIGFLLASLNVFATKAVSRRREDLSRSMLNDQGRFAAATLGSIRTIETLKAGGLENESYAYWAGYQAKVLNGIQSLGILTALLAAVPVLMETLTHVAILGVGGFRVMEGHLTVGALVAIQSLMMSFTQPISGLVNLGGKLQTIKGDLARLEDVNEHPTSELLRSQRAAECADQQKLSGRFQMKGVSFSYSPFDNALLENFNLNLKPGSRVALVGGSGSGKSTLGKLMCGLLEPTAGQILFDGQDIGSIPREVFSSSVAYVDQDVFMFEGSIRDNLTLWQNDIGDEVITRVLKDAAILDDVSTRLNGYDSPVLEGGTNFSGGQRQRLELARALVTEPALVILDEATSSLDPVTEKLIDDNLRRRGCACVIIAHRLSTIRDCDEIIVLDCGEIIERGTHESLLALKGFYAQLIEMEGQ